jgi:ribonucleoside-diphosphate reductase alpha chain
MNNKLKEYFCGDELAADVWKKKYAQEGEITPDDMHMRMAKQFARIEDNYKWNDGKVINSEKLSVYGTDRTSLTEESIYKLFKDFKYIIPQGSIMSQLGSKSIGSLSNCFVIGQPEDSYGGIFQKDEEQAQLMKRRGGVGQDISTLRPATIATSNAAKSSTGPVSFMHRFSNTTREVAQDGRRGALMLSMHINHPDVLDFIKVKRNDTEVTGANISIKLTNEFMEAVEKDDKFILRYPCDMILNSIEKAHLKIECKQDKLIPLTEKRGYIRVINAKEYWNEIIESAHQWAEPGIMFEENHHNYSPDGVYPQFKGVTTNPCGEIFMQPYDACRLIATNLFSFVVNPFTKDAYFDHKKYYEVNYEAMRLSDDLIDLEMEHIQRIVDKIDNDSESYEVKLRERELWEKVYKTAQASRRTGLGFTALGDCLAALGVSYAGKDGLKHIELIMKTKMKSELDCTIDLAVLRGTFEGWDHNEEFVGVNIGVACNDFYQMLLDEFPEQARRMSAHGRRNVSWGTIAPTGSLSIIAKAIKYSNLSSGMEPTFMPYYMRRKKVNINDEGTRVDFTDSNGDTWQEYAVVMGAFRDWYDITCRYSDGGLPLEELPADIVKNAFEMSPWFGSTANDISWEDRVKVQALLQKYVSHSISSTVNLPEDIERNVVGNIYMKAWKQGLKGITVYRDGSRSGVLISNDKKKFEASDAVKRPKELKAHTYYSTSKGESYHVIVGLLEDKPYEIFIDDSDNKYSSKGKIVKEARGKYVFKNGGDPINIRTFMTDEQEATTRLVSALLRHGTDVKFVVEQLQKTPGDMFSFTKSLARVLKKYIPNGVSSTVHCLNKDCTGDGTNVIFEEGCNKCRDCGSSKCG